MRNLRKGERERNLRSGERKRNLTFLDLCPSLRSRSWKQKFLNAIHSKQGSNKRTLLVTTFQFPFSLSLSLFPSLFVPQILSLPLFSPTFLVIVASRPEVRKEEMRKEKFGIFFRFLFSFSNT